MGFLKESLAQHERLLYEARFNWTHDVSAWAWFFVGAAPLGSWALYDIFAKPEPPVLSDPAALIASAASAALGVSFALTRYVDKWTTVIALTSERLILKRGFIARASLDVALRQIEEVDFVQSFWGRLCGYGRFVIAGEGVGVVKLPNIDRPVAFRQALEEAVVARRGAMRGRDAEELSGVARAAHDCDAQGRPLRKRRFVRHVAVAAAASDRRASGQSA
ncbi:MAG: PH domain-containing protein [Pseudomonadota bacterium]